MDAATTTAPKVLVLRGAAHVGRNSSRSPLQGSGNGLGMISLTRAPYSAAERRRQRSTEFNCFVVTPPLSTYSRAANPSRFSRGRGPWAQDVFCISTGNPLYSIHQREQAVRGSSRLRIHKLLSGSVS